jgi:hypothetical protein
MTMYPQDVLKNTAVIIEFGKAMLSCHALSTCKLQKTLTIHFTMENVANALYWIQPGKA